MLPLPSPSPVPETCRLKIDKCVKTDVKRTFPDTSFRRSRAPDGWMWIGRGSGQAAGQSQTDWQQATQHKAQWVWAQRRHGTGQWNPPFEVLQHPAFKLRLWKLPLKLRQRLIKPQMNRSLHCHKQFLSSAGLRCSGSSLLEKHGIQPDISAANLFAEYLL